MSQNDAIFGAQPAGQYADDLIGHSRWLRASGRGSSMSFSPPEPVEGECEQR